MYIQPNTTIKFLQNIPFDADYNDTVYFTPKDGVQGQFTYFNAKAKYTIQNNMYQRVNKNELKVSLPYTGITYESTAEKLYDCNYMMFQNTNFGNKWFYAFVNTVEWINNETAKITYEIDEMQTWMFDYDLEQCFVEREHSATDEIGDNLVPENLDMGYEYIEQARTKFHFTHKLVPTTEDELKYGWSILVFASEIAVASVKHQPYAYYITHPETRMFGPIQSGVLCIPFNASFIDSEHGNNALRNSPYFAGYNMPTDNKKGDLNDFYDFISVYNDADVESVVADDILMIYICPTLLLNNRNSMTEYETISLTRPTAISYPAYAPNNNKLFTYPYMQLVVTNYHGGTQTYKYEYFQDHKQVGGIKFRISGTPVFSPAIVCSPMRYKPATNILMNTSPLEGIDYSLTINDFTQCSWQNDNFKAWWAQNKNSATYSAIMGVLSGVVSTVAGGMIGATTPFGFVMAGSGITSAAKSVGNLLTKKEDAENMPVSVGGLTNNSALLEINDMVGFGFSTKSIIPQQAKIIDDYFTMFGYACHEVKTPNRNVRPKWTYTQTVGCTIKARCPGDSQKKICQIYDKGIRFWNKNAEIGKYYDDNGTPINNSPTAG